MSTTKQTLATQTHTLIAGYRKAVKKINSDTRLSEQGKAEKRAELTKKAQDDAQALRQRIQELLQMQSSQRVSHRRHVSNDQLRPAIDRVRKELREAEGDFMARALELLEDAALTNDTATVSALEQLVPAVAVTLHKGDSDQTQEIAKVGASKLFEQHVGQLWPDWSKRTSEAVEARTQDGKDMARLSLLDHVLSTGVTRDVGLTVPSFDDDGIYEIPPIAHTDLDD